MGACSEKELIKRPLGISKLNLRALPSCRAAWLNQTKHLKNRSLMQETSLCGKRQRQAWFTSPANPAPPGILDFSTERGARLRSGLSAGSTWLRLLGQHGVSYLSCKIREFLVGLMAGSLAREGLNSAHIPLTPHYRPAGLGCLCLFKWSSLSRGMLVRSWGW